MGDKTEWQPHLLDEQCQQNIKRKRHCTHTTKLRLGCYDKEAYNSGLWEEVDYTSNEGNLKDTF